MDAGLTPTHWQHAQFPAHSRGRITVVHDGINAAKCRPNPDAVLTLPSGRRFRPGDPVVTYVSRNLEPIRGFPQFMRAAERLLSARNDVEVVIIGGDEVSYSPAHPSGRTWREVLLDEIDVDRSRIHFLGKVPYEDFVATLQVSAAHVYLTVPFVLSWSTLEAMAAGCVVIGSDTEPVREVIRDGENGLLVDFFDRDALVEQIGRVLDDPARFRKIRENARATILEEYSRARCLPLQEKFVESLATAG